MAYPVQQLTAPFCLRGRAAKTKPRNHGSMISRMEDRDGHRGMLGHKALIEGAEFARTIAKPNKGKKRIQAVAFYFWIVPKNRSITKSFLLLLPYLCLSVPPKLRIRLLLNRNDNFEIIVISKGGTLKNP